MSLDERLVLFKKSLLDTNRGFNFYVDWKKPSNVLKNYKIEVDTLNGLIQNENYDNDFKEILRNTPTVINLFPLLIALAKKEVQELNEKEKKLKVVNSTTLGGDLLEYSFGLDEGEDLTDHQIDDYLEFTKKMGIKNLFTNILQSNLGDYIIGCEVGLDTHARKNRSGKAFQDALSPIIKDISKELDIEVITEKQFKVLLDKGFSISPDFSERKADFILIKDTKVINIEVNFYNGAGSKPEEIIESYINRQNELRENNIGFILITDGLKCWGNAKKPQLEKGFRHLAYLLNFNMAKHNLLKEILEEYFK